MEYNKKQFHKVNDKKILHKIGKHWVSIGLSTLMAIGGIAVSTQSKSAVQADSIDHPEVNHSVMPMNSTGQHSSASLVSAGRSVDQSSASRSSTISDRLGSLQQQANVLHASILNHSLIKPSASGNLQNQSPHSDFGQSSHASLATEQSVYSLDAASGKSSQSNKSSGSSSSNNKRGSASSANSKSNSSSSSSSNSSRNSSSASSNASSHSTDNAITVQYFNQHNKMVGSGTIPSRAKGTKVDVINPQDGGIPLPNGYDFNNNQDPNATFYDGRTQLLQYGVSGKPVDTNINVTIVKKGTDPLSDNYITSDTKSVNIKGIVGDTVDIQPRDYVPAAISSTNYYYIDPADHSTTLMFHPNDAQHLTPYLTQVNGTTPIDHIKYQYDKYQKNPQVLGQVTVHYQDINKPNVDINHIPFHGVIGTTFNLQDYQDNIPQGYYYVSTYIKTPKGNVKLSRDNVNQYKYSTQPHDVLVNVRPLLYVKATLQFKVKDPSSTQNGKVISSHVLLSRSAGKKIDYSFLANNYAPKGYIPTSNPIDPHNDPVLKAGDVDTIYVKPGYDGLITVNYRYNNRVVDSISDKQPLGTAFTLSHYLDHAPLGYKSVDPAHQVIDGQNVEQFTKKPQQVDIRVVPEIGSDQVAIPIRYYNLDDSNNLLKSTSDVAKIGSKIDYSKYEKAPDLPSGYKYDHSSGSSNFQDGAYVNIYVKPVESRGESRIYIDYKNINNMSQIVKRASDQGKTGASVDLHKYETAPYLPSGYKFIAPEITNSTFQNGQHEVLLVKKVSTPQPQPSGHHSHQATGTIVYRDDQTNDVEGQVPITGPQDEQIDYSKYISNDSQYMPSGYHYYELSPGIGKFLVPNAKYTILVRANQVNQKSGTININYQDSSNGHIIQSYHPRQTAGTPFNVQDYIAQVPSNYVFDKISNGNDVKQFTDQTQNITLIVSKQSQQLHEILKYQDLATGSDVGNVPLNGPVGMKIDYDSYKNQVPSGYTFDRFSKSNPASLQPNASYIVLVTKKPSSDQNQVMGSLIYRDVANDQMIGNQQTLKGTKGQSINFTQYDNQIPQGYHLVANPSDTTLESNQEYVIKVAANKKSSDQTQVTDQLIYQDVANQQTVGNQYTLKGTKGQLINFAQYDDDSSRMPSGYHLVSNPSNNILEPGQEYVIRVASNGPVTGNILINYRNSSDNQIISHQELTRPVGTTFGAQDYLGKIPNGYHLDRIDAGQQVTNFTKNNQTVDVLVSANSVQVSDPLVYRDVNNGKVINETHTINGLKGQKINFSQYENSASYLPAGYHFTGLADPSNDILEPNQRYVLLVAPNVNYGQIEINYRNANNPDQIVDHHTLREPVGNAFSAADYLDLMPLGYHFKRLDDNYPVTKFAKNEQTVDVLISNQNSDQTVTDPLIYQDVNTKQTVGNQYQLKGMQGQPINFAQYDNNNHVPKGYHVIANPINTTLEPGQKYVVKVASNVNYGYIDLNYLNVDNQNQVLGHHVLKAPVGYAFNANDYRGLMPAGYKFDSVERSHNPKFFIPGHHIADVLVSAINNNSGGNGNNNNGGHANHNDSHNGGNANDNSNHGNHSNNNQSTQDGVITVMYVNPHNHVVSEYRDSQPVGTVFNSSDYMNRLPYGYQFKGIMEGSQVNHFVVNPQNIMVMVAVDRSRPASSANNNPTPSPAPNPEPDSNSIASSSVTPSPSPASSSNSTSNSTPSSSSSNPSNSASSSSSTPQSTAPSHSNSSQGSSSVPSSEPSSAPGSGSAGGQKSAVPNHQHRPASSPTSGQPSNGHPTPSHHARHGVTPSTTPGPSGKQYRGHEGGTNTSYTDDNPSSPLAQRISNNTDSTGASSHYYNSVPGAPGVQSPQNNGQSNRLPQTGERMNSRMMDAFAWLALAAMLSMWGSVADRRRRNR